MSSKYSPENDLFRPPADVAAELVSLLYESLRQASARNSFHERLARHIGVDIQSIVIHSRSNGSVVTYGSASDGHSFISQPLDGATCLPASKAGSAEDLAIYAMPPKAIETPAANEKYSGRWSLVWTRGDSLVRLAVSSLDANFAPAAFLSAQRDFLNYVLPHLSAAYSIFCKQQARAPRLNGVRALHAMLPLPLIIVKRGDKSLVPNVQALRSMNSRPGVRPAEGPAQARLAGNNSSSWQVQRSAGSVRLMNGESGGRHSLAQLNGLGVNSLGMGYQVHLLQGQTGCAAAVNPNLLAECFGLNAAEADLCACVMAGKNPQTIAEDLGFPINTVKSRLKSIYRRIGVRSVVQLAACLYFHPAYWTANYGQRAKTRMLSPDYDC